MMTADLTAKGPQQLLKTRRRVGPQRPGQFALRADVEKTDTRSSKPQNRHRWDEEYSRLQQALFLSRLTPARQLISELAYSHRFLTGSPSATPYNSIRALTHEFSHGCL
jgi:hypothetical protein